MEHMHGASITSRLVVAGLLLGCAACAGPEGRAAVSERGGDVGRTVVVEFVPEMERFDRGVDESPVAVTPGVRSAFESAWAGVRASVAARVTAAELAGISRWAVEETRGFAPEPGWIGSLAMEPIGGSADGRYVLFGQRAEGSAARLPGHSPIVQRRLIVAPVFDVQSRSIGRVLVTIRGWAEE